jgi:hypothetical protein
MAIVVEDPWWKYAYSTMFASIRGQRWGQPPMKSTAFLSLAAPVAAAAYGYGSSATQNGLIRATVSAGQRASGMLSPRSILVKMRVALIPSRIVRTMTPNSASSTVMDERRSVLAEDRDLRDLLDRHHDGSEIHGQLALSANVPAAAQASIICMRRNPSGLDLPLAPSCVGVSLQFRV